MTKTIKIEEAIDVLDNAVIMLNVNLVGNDTVTLDAGIARSILRLLRSQKEDQEMEQAKIAIENENIKATLIHVNKGNILYHAHCSAGLVIMVVPADNEEARSFGNIEDATNLIKYITGFIPKKSLSTF